MGFWKTVTVGGFEHLGNALTKNPKTTKSLAKAAAAEAKWYKTAGKVLASPVLIPLNGAAAVAGSGVNRYKAMWRKAPIITGLLTAGTALGTGAMILGRRKKSAEKQDPEQLETIASEQEQNAQLQELLQMQAMQQAQQPLPQQGMAPQPVMAGEPASEMTSEGGRLISSSSGTPPSGVNTYQQAAYVPSEGMQVDNTAIAANDDPRTQLAAGAEYREPQGPAQLPQAALAHPV